MGKELKSFVGKTGRYLNNVKSPINNSFPVSFHCLLFTEKGGIGRDRTGGLVLRRHSLYPTELRPLFSLTMIRHPRLNCRLPSTPSYFLFYGRNLGSMLILFALEGFFKILAVGGINSQQKRPEQC